MKKRLLVVDDDLSVRESLKIVLEKAGYDVALAADGKEAESELDDPKIELLILDLHMPNRSGWDVLRDISSERPLLPVIIITGGLIDGLSFCSFPDVAAVLKKPIEVENLLRLVEQLIAETTDARFRRITRSAEDDSTSQTSEGDRQAPDVPASFQWSLRTKKTGHSFAE